LELAVEVVGDVDVDRGRVPVVGDAGQAALVLADGVVVVAGLVQGQVVEGDPALGVVGCRARFMAGLPVVQVEGELVGFQVPALQVLGGGDDGLGRLGLVGW